MEDRTPVAAVTKDGLLIVVCSDGSVWSTRGPGGRTEWTEYVPVPGSKADAEDQN